MKKIYSCLSILFIGITTCAGQTISLTGSTYTQNFDALSNVAGSTTNNLTIPGWFMTESGGGVRDNEQYAVDPGSSTTGDTYSYGAAAATDRALGNLRSGTLISISGAAFTNNTGSTIQSLSIGYTGEEWRLGTASRTDQLNFQYSTNATDLVTGTWTTVTALNFVTPNTAIVGALDGNAAANRTVLSTTINSLSIPNGATFWIRWTDNDATGADDGLAVDDFTLTTTTLAVNGINFFAVKEDQTGKINWTTQQEINSSYFIVERSADGANWKSIDQIPAAGNSSAMLHYAVTDNAPLFGNNFYRLRMVDKDNKITYSDICKLNFNKDHSYTVYPDPAQDFILITADRTLTRSTVLELVNPSGQVLVQKRSLTGPQPVRINVAALKPGLYYVRITSANGERSLLPFVKR
jgi:hypothetical protein